MCSEVKTSCNEIRDILKVILILQEKACRKIDVLDTCEKGFLGPCNEAAVCNTRPIMLFTKCGDAWEMPYNDETSSVFKIEKLGNCTATFRVLEPVVNEETTYNLTNSFFTINLDCICAIKCLPDVLIESAC